MTKLTNWMREDILMSIMKNLPTKNYAPLIVETVQEVVVEFMPPEVRTLWDNPLLRRYLNPTSLNAKMGNRTMSFYDGRGYVNVIYGLGSDEFTLRADEAAMEAVKEGSLAHVILVKRGVADMIREHFEQQDLRDNVRKRLKGNLEAVGTVKRLYDVLEPELHHYIPREEVARHKVPSTVAPVVADLKRLGATLPDTPKAEGV